MATASVPMRVHDTLSTAGPLWSGKVMSSCTTRPANTQAMTPAELSLHTAAPSLPRRLSRSEMADDTNTSSAEIASAHATWPDKVIIAVRHDVPSSEGTRTSRRVPESAGWSRIRLPTSNPAKGKTLHAKASGGDEGKGIEERGGGED